MENSLLAIFDEIWPKTLYYSTGTFVQILSKFKNSKKNSILIGINSNYLLHIRICICIRKCSINGELSPSHFCQNFANCPVL